MTDVKKSRILVVDDDPAIVFLLSNLLEDKGYAVLTAADGAIALDCAITDHPDLILLDILLPDMEGMEVCAKLRQNPVTHDIPIIFLTAYNTEDRLEEAMDMGGDDFLGKPINVVELTVRIQAMLQTRNITDEFVRHNEYINTIKTLRAQSSANP